MTDRISALTVVLERNIRDDDIEPTIAAIRQIRGVLRVKPIVSDVSLLIAESRAEAEWRRKILGLLDLGEQREPPGEPR